MTATRSFKNPANFIGTHNVTLKWILEEVCIDLVQDKGPVVDSWINGNDHSGSIQYWALVNFACHRMTELS
jgi:hypothetical protein